MQPGGKTPAQAVKDGVARQLAVRDGVREAVKAVPAVPPRSTLEDESGGASQPVNAGRE